jgi:hypothetical protein
MELTPPSAEECDTYSSFDAVTFESQGWGLGVLMVL